MKSMTAYGRGEYELDSSQYVAEIKSLNNRYRDIKIRLPNDLLVLEDELRAQISSKIKRGRIEVSIQIQKNAGENGYDIELNKSLLKGYLDIFNQLNKEFGLENSISIDGICQLKDVILVKPESLDLDKVRNGIRESMQRALDSLDTMRLKEGKAIEVDFLARLDIIENFLEKIEEKSFLVVDEYKKKLTEKIGIIAQDIELDANRLVQEVVLFSSRSDITEEIVRIKSHIEQFRAYMSLNDSIGRRLDFLIQEFNREINTISSKASDSFISKIAVEFKAELEKLREQVQNIE